MQICKISISISSVLICNNNVIYLRNVKSIIIYCDLVQISCLLFPFSCPIAYAFFFFFFCFHYPFFFFFLWIFLFQSHSGIFPHQGRVCGIADSILSKKRNHMFHRWRDSYLHSAIINYINQERTQTQKNEKEQRNKKVETRWKKGREEEERRRHEKQDKKKIPRFCDRGNVNLWMDRYMLGE